MSEKASRTPAFLKALMPRPLHDILEELINLRKLSPTAQSYRPRLVEVIRKIAAEKTKAEGEKRVDSKNLDKLFNLDLLRQYHELRLSDNYKERKKRISIPCKWETQEQVIAAAMINPFTNMLPQKKNNSGFGTQSATCREIQRISRLIKEETERMPEAIAAQKAAEDEEIKRVKNDLDTEAENLIAQRAAPLAIELSLELMKSSTRVPADSKYWERKIIEYKTTGLEKERSTFEYYCNKYGDSLCRRLLRAEVEKQVILTPTLKALLPPLSGGARRRQTRRKQAKGKGKGKKSTRRR
jgi:hypothetical protein